ncbi:CUGBP Elav-like family member 6 isoform X1 [Drosophila eugracilis]|uniref:CUGBP Elav-like family member 6 isoform X1 n=1 Tax=Drosophila eugracilis TaxID=29029 RepID=UPI001BD9DC73|nr:CUGBP Elav-like family member 6 isoform X1 [Drosophila eugracilis]XP_041674730.1 CUGBP Elav-like family member 6 isoform X1 [Drosophila eugracilis]
MLFENPAVAAKLPFPYNVPPPLQAAAAAAAAVPNLRFQTPIKAFACLTAATRSVSEMNATSLYAGNPMENAAAAAAAAAAGLIDPHHNRDLHQALVASIANNGVAAIGGGLTTAAVLKSAAQQSQQAVVQQQTQNSVVVSAGQDQPKQEQAQQAALALLKENVNASAGAGQNNGQPAMGGSNKSGSSGRSTPSLSGGSGSDPAPGKLFVGGLSWQTSSDKLKEYFNMFGTVTDVLIMKDPVTQRSRGFGFITFQEPCTVEKVLKVPIHTLDGKKIDPKHATPKNRPRQANKTKKIFVGGVSQDTSAEEVKAYFSQFGPVEETVMLMDQQTKRHRGFGFVTFENEDVVDRVCEIHFHTIKNKKVECKKAQPKEAVTPAAQLLQKRIMLGTLGVQLPTAPGQLLGARGAGVAAMNPLAMLQNPTQLLQSPAAAAAAQQAALISQNPFQVQNAAAAASMANQAGFGKLLTTYPQTALHSVRYAPYSIPASAATANAALMQAHQAQSVAAAAHHQQQQQQHHHQQQTHNAHVAAAQQQQQSHHSAVSNPASQAHSAAAAAALAANAANGAGAAGAHSLAAAAQQAGLMAGNPLNAAAAAAAAAANPAAAYSNYALANVDMSSFQGVDWSTMYGMGMYV